MVSSAMPSSSSRSSSCADVACRGRSSCRGTCDCHRPAWPRLSGLVWVTQVHVGDVAPDEERRVRLVLALDEVDGARRRSRRRWSPSAWRSAGRCPRCVCLPTGPYRSSASSDPRRWPMSGCTPRGSSELVQPRELVLGAGSRRCSGSSSALRWYRLPKNSSKPCTVGRYLFRSPRWFLPNCPVA